MVDERVLSHCKLGFWESKFDRVLLQIESNWKCVIPLCWLIKRFDKLHKGHDKGSNENLQKKKKK